MRKKHFIAGQKNNRTTTACGLYAGDDGVIHVPPRQATCKNCKKIVKKLKK